MSLPGLGAAETIGAILAFLLGGFVKGGLGFGQPMVTLALMPLFLPVDLALTTNALVMPVLNAWQVVLGGRLGAVLARAWPLVGTLALTMPLGVLLATQVAPGGLMAVLGLVLMAVTVTTAVDIRVAIAPRWERGTAVLAGGLAGIVGGVTTITGPFALVWLIGIGADRRFLITTLGLYFLTTGLVLALSYSAVGLLDGSRVALALLCLPGAVAGMWLGNRLAARMRVEAFRRMVLGVLFLLGANILWRGLTG